MTARGSRSAAALAFVLAAACTPESSQLAPPPEDAAADAGGDAGDAGDAGPPCVPGGRTALEPITVACRQAAPGRVGVDGDNVYWTVQKPGAVVLKADLEGGGAVPLVYDDAPAVGLAVGIRYVFYTQPSAGRVMRVPKGGGLPVAVAKGQDSPFFLAIDLESDEPALYWTGGSGNNGVVMRLALVADATPTLMMDGQARPRAIAVRNGYVYWTDFVDGSLLRMPARAVTPEPATDGGAPDAADDAGADAAIDAPAMRTATRLASGVKGPSDLALTDDFAYLPDQAGRIVRVPLAGGALQTVADVHGVPFGVATNGLALYWSTLGNGAIYRLRLSGNPPVEAIAPAEQDPHFLAVSSAAVFWGAWGGGGTIRKFAR
jgi:hypothetical protein